MLNTIIRKTPNSAINFLTRYLTKYRSLIRKEQLANTIGKDLSFDHLESLELLQLIKSNHDLSSPVIYDIGACVGTWTKLALSIFESASIYCFEPITEHFLNLENALHSNKQVKTFNFAIGAENTEKLINVTNHSDASSLLSVADFTFKKFHISTQRTTAIQVKSLDSLIAEVVLPRPDIIKLDIQGYELEALKGCENALISVSYIICEVSFVKFYENQAFFSDIVTFLNGFGFELHSLSTTTPLGCALEQTDVLFKKVKR